MKNTIFCCKNRKFTTNNSKGYKGSVTRFPLYKDDEVILRLEYVLEFKIPNNELFWLMWYKSDGTPLLPGSAVFDKFELKKIIKSFSKIEL